MRESAISMRKSFINPEMTKAPLSQAGRTVHVVQNLFKLDQQRSSLIMMMMISPSALHAGVRVRVSPQLSQRIYWLSLPRWAFENVLSVTVAAKSYSICSAFLTKYQLLSSKQASLCFLFAANVALLTKLQ